jgi:UDP-glucuronate 4-epimerase
MKHYIITGGAGFIGSNLTRHLLKNEPGLKITCIDNFDPFYSADIKQYNIHDFKDNPSYRLIETDLAKATDASLAELVPEKVDVVVHLAAKAGVRPSIENPLSYQQANVIGLQNMLDFAKLKGIKQFVFASSSSVYGINDHYAMTKLAGEMLGHVYHKLFGVRFIALRFFTVYGPGQRPDLAIHKFTKNIIAGKPIAMFGDGSTSRDYTYVDDTVQGITGAIHYDKTGFEILNLGNHYTITLKELIEGIEKVTGKKAIINHQPDQPGDVPKTYADIAKAKALLGYDPKTQIHDGLKKFYDWFMQHEAMLVK